MVLELMCQDLTRLLLAVVGHLLAFAVARDLTRLLLIVVGHLLAFACTSTKLLGTFEPRERQRDMHVYVCMCMCMCMYVWMCTDLFFF
jgi:hypothetical protein